MVKNSESGASGRGRTAFGVMGIAECLPKGGGRYVIRMSAA